MENIYNKEEQYASPGEQGGQLLEEDMHSDDNSKETILQVEAMDVTNQWVFITKNGKRNSKKKSKVDFFELRCHNRFAVLNENINNEDVNIYDNNSLPNTKHQNVEKKKNKKKGKENVEEWVNTSYLSKIMQKN